MAIGAIAVVRLDGPVGVHPAHGREIGRVNTGSRLPENPVGDREYGGVAANDQRNQDDRGSTDSGGLRQEADA